MYLVPRWMALYGAVLVVLAALVLVWQSPALGLIAALTLVAVLLVGVGATPARLQARIGRITDTPADTEAEGEAGP